MNLVVARNTLGLPRTPQTIQAVAVIISLVAVWDLKRSAGTQTPKYGMGRAVFGLIMGLLGTVVLVMILLSGTLFRSGARPPLARREALPNGSPSVRGTE